MLLLLSDPATAATLIVDWAGSGDFTTIQEGLDAAAAGDTVLVLQGTYHEHLLMGSGADGVALVSQAGPDLTVVTGDSIPPYPVLRCQDVGSSTLVEGFTFRAGESQLPGAGINCEYLASPSIVGNIIRDCWVKYPGTYGGGIAVDRGSPVIERNSVVHNRAIDGGGLSLFGGNAVVRDNRIERNTADGWGGSQSGGGIYVADGSHLIENNTIAGNHAQSFGGAMMLGPGSVVTLLSNTITGNTSELGSGGVFIRDATVDAAQNTVVGNSGPADGAAVTITSLSSRSPCIFEDNVIFGNISDDPDAAAVHVVKGQSPRFRCNLLVNLTQFEVKISEAPSVDTLDFTENWWGVTDSTLIAARIWDCWDDPGLGACVDFSNWCADPSCSGEATSVPEFSFPEEASWGRIKSIYR
jgi:hypothetical protein